MPFNECREEGHVEAFLPVLDAANARVNRTKYSLDPEQRDPELYKVSVWMKHLCACRKGLPGWAWCQHHRACP